MMASFFATLRAKLTKLEYFPTRDAAQLAVFDYIGLYPFWWRIVCCVSLGSVSIICVPKKITTTSSKSMINQEIELKGVFIVLRFDTN